MQPKGNFFDLRQGFYTQRWQGLCNRWRPLQCTKSTVIIKIAFAMSKYSRRILPVFSFMITIYT